MKSTERAELQTSVQKQLLTLGIEKQSLVLAAVSGGLDSTALLYLLHNISLKLSFRLEAVYIDHGIRSGEENTLDEHSVKRNCHLLSIPLHVYHITSGSIVSEAEQSGQSIEETARSRRYDIFNKLLERRSAACLCTGHHADDQAETVLMRFLEGRGSVRGLKGIPRQRGLYFRPLLGIGRAELEALMKSSYLQWHEDASNSDITIKRNCLRKKWLPLLQEDFPGIRNTLAEWAGYFEEMNSLFEASLEGKIVWEYFGGRLWRSSGCNFNDLSYQEKKYFLLTILNRIHTYRNKEDNRIPDRFFREIDRISSGEWIHHSKAGVFASRGGVLYYKYNQNLPGGISYLIQPGKQYTIGNVCFSLSQAHTDNSTVWRLKGSCESNYIIRRKLPGDAVGSGKNKKSLTGFLKSSGILDIEFEDILLVCSNNEIRVILSERSGPLFPAGEYGTGSMYLSWSFKENLEDVYAE